MNTVLEVRQLTVDFALAEGWMRVLYEVSFTLERGEILGLVGESGCGKSVTALTLMGLLQPPHARVAAGQVLLHGADLLALSAARARRYHGSRLCMIFQEPGTALDPVFTLGQQIGAVLRRHQGLSRKQARARSIALLQRVGIADAAHTIDCYPHQFSGGMRQRAMIAMALACGPDVLIADEATTALDGSTQAAILDLLDGLRRETGMAILLISHDLAVVAQICDRAMVMYGGRIVESARVGALFETPRHPYTQGLLAAVPDCFAPRPKRLPIIAGRVPTLGHWPCGCPFSNRCGKSSRQCVDTTPPLRGGPSTHQVACHHA